MTYPDLDTQRLTKLEQDYDAKCINSLPFSPTDIVEWACNSNGHKWLASPIELQIDQGCLECSPGNAVLNGNGGFALSMSKNLSTLADDFKNGTIQGHRYLHYAELHIHLASFFFHAVRVEFVIKAISNSNSNLGLVDTNGKEYNMIQLVQRLHDEASNNVALFNIRGYTTQVAQTKFSDSKDKMDLYVFARNKIGHGYSKFPVTKSGNFKPDLANLIKSFGAGGLNDFLGYVK